MENEKSQNNSPEPHVTFFGEEVGGAKTDKAACPPCGRRCPCGRYESCRCCGGGFGGIIVIMVGVVLVLNNAGIVSWDVWDAMMRFWPVLLVVIGMKIIFGRNAAGRIVTGLVAIILCFFIFLVGLAHTGSPLFPSMHLPAGIVNIINQVK